MIYRPHSQQFLLELLSTKEIAPINSDDSVSSGLPRETGDIVSEKEMLLLIFVIFQYCKCHKQTWKTEISKPATKKNKTMAR